MSDIFEALQKAQREAEERAAGIAGPEARGNGIGAETSTPLEPAAAAPAPATRRHHRRGWLSWLRNGASRNGHERHVPVLESGHASQLSEHFRVLRTQVEMAGPSTIMVTSALDQEGKTLCAINLAIALAMRAGSHVILCDADLRKPSVAASLGLAHGPGLTECLLDEAVWRDCLLTTRYEGLRVLPAGRHTAQAPELLGSDRMRQITAELKAEFPDHYIVFDAPPVLLTADPLILARNMDHALLVVRAGITPRAAVQKAIDTLGAESLLGIILNDVTESVSNYYYYGYGSQYGYGKAGKAST